MAKLHSAVHKQYSSEYYSQGSTEYYDQKVQYESSYTVLFEPPFFLEEEWEAERAPRNAILHLGNTTETSKKLSIKLFA